MFNILTLNKISQNGLKHLPSECYSITDAHDNPDGIILRSFAMHEYALPEKLLGVARAGAGVNNIPIDKCSEKGIVVFNTPGANANAVKELVIAGLLMTSRDIVGGINWVQGLAGTEGVAAAVEKGKASFGGTEISGKKLGVLGLGAIGVLVANAASALGMEVMGYDPFLSQYAKDTLCKSVKSDATIDEIFASCDFITVHVPYMPETKGLVNAEKLGKAKKGVKILNFARAELVNNADMKAALESGQAAAYITDFPTEEVLGTKGIIPVPHLGASTEESEENCAEMAAKQLKDYLETGNIKNSVNFPNIAQPKSGKARLCVFSKKCDEFCGKVKSAAESEGLAVVNCYSVTKGDYSYYIVDLDKENTGKLTEKVQALGGMKVRVI